MDVLKDLAELKALRSNATRPVVTAFLEEKIHSLEKLVQNSMPSSAAISGDGTIVKESARALLPTIKITDYAWDQSDKFVKLYLTIPGIHNVEKDQISITYCENSISFHGHAIESKDFTLLIKGLLHKIVPSKCYFKQKTDMLLVMMKKEDESLKWDYLTSAEMQSKEKSKPKFDEKADPQESLMNMMKTMYDEGDDEMKRTIRKAWHESQTKKDSMDFKEPDLSL